MLLLVGFSVVLRNITSGYDQRVLTFPIPLTTLLDGGSSVRTPIIAVGPRRPYLVFIENYMCKRHDWVTAWHPLM